MEISNKDWFVCLHIRSAGFHANDGNTQDFRNVPIEHYYPVIDMICEHGGYIMRMGDPSMPKLDLSKLKYPKQVIDYAHSPWRSGELDVALSGTCRMFITSQSGLYTVARAFGRPILATNFLYSSNLGPKDITLPAFYYSHKKKRRLKLEEIARHIFYSDHQVHLDAKDITIEFITPEDIAEGAKEILFAKPSTSKFTVCPYFSYLNKKYGSNFLCRFSENYLNTYTQVLGFEK